MRNRVGGRPKGRGVGGVWEGGREGEVAYEGQVRKK